LKWKLVPNYFLPRRSFVCRQKKKVAFLTQINTTMNFPAPSLTETILLTTLGISWLLQLWFLLARIRPLAFYKQAVATTTFDEPVSVIICAKNEAENLKLFLPQILNQKYPSYEVIVVNDSSEDDSDLVLAGIKQQYPGLYYTTIQKDKKFSHGKKLALTIGVKAAKNRYLLLTDADCQPASEHWLNEMAQGFADSSKEIVLGFGGYEKRKGFFNQLVRYDSFFTAMQYLGFALSGRPYMGVGRNLAYTKDLFVGKGGVKKHAHLLSGDDDLFVQDSATKQNTAVVINASSQTISTAPTNFGEWLQQKSRHLSTNRYYKAGIKFELAFEPLSRQFFLFISAILIFFNTFATVAIGLFLFRLIVLLVFWQKAAKQLNQGRIYWAVLIYDWLHPWLLLMAQFGHHKRRNKYRWK
jgi:cellulose synthase/poly-beta-1,6-N-acetylglucosamine synthase-like glycosyltransferase